jgi:hypothetical protein
VLVGVSLALPFVVVRYPPMGDLAFHEAGIALLRHLGDPRFAPVGLYEMNLGEPNQLFHLLAYALSFVVPTDWACKLVVAATVVATSIGAGALARHLEVTRWSALIVAPLALGWMCRWGLVANLLGFAVLLAALPVLDSSASAPSGRRALLSSGLGGVLYLAHESSMLIYALAALLFAVRTPPRPRPLALAFAPAAFAGVLALAYQVRSASLKAPSILAVRTIDVALPKRVLDLPGALFSVGKFGPLMLAASVAAVALLAFPSRRGAAMPGPSKRLVPWRFVSLGLLCAVGYLFMPEALLGSTLIYQRFLPPAFAVLVMSLLPRGLPSARVASVVVLLPMGMLASTWHLFSEANRSYRDLDVVLAHMDDCGAVAQLDLTPRNPSMVAPVVGAAARALAVHGGRLLFSFTDAPTYPVTMPPAKRWDEPVQRLAPTPFAFAPAYDLTRFRYVLVWAPVAAVRTVLEDAFAPEAKLVVGSGDWLLFESTLQTVSLLAPDGSPPRPMPQPLASRVKALLALRALRTR